MYNTGNFLPFWKDYYKNLPYSRNRVFDTTDEAYWKSIGFSNKFFTGEMAVVKKNRDCWTEKFFNLFPGRNVGVTFYKMSPGIVMPAHKDKFNYYKKFFKPNKNETIFRAIIFLEDWQPGHIFEIEGNLFSSWSAGDYVLWNEQSLHLAANLGFTDRYTVQITFTNVQ